MSSVGRVRHARQLSPSDVLAQLSGGEDLEHAIRLCLQAICRQTGCRAVSLSGIAAEAAAGFDTVSPEAARVKVVHQPLFFQGSERAKLALYPADSYAPRLRSKRLNGWLGLLALLCEAAGAETEQSLFGCLRETAFLARLHEEWERSKRYGRMLSLVALGSVDDRAAENGAAEAPDASQLLQLGCRLREKLRSHDVVGMSGGVLRCLLTDTDAVGAKIALARIKGQLPMLLGVAEPRADAPCWLAAAATFPQDGATPESLLSAVDKRLGLVSGEGV